MEIININSLAPDELREVERQLTVNLKKIVDKAIFEANQHLNPYGIEAIMAIELVPAGGSVSLKSDNLESKAAGFKEE
jgi:hypothetical protein